MASTKGSSVHIDHVFTSHAIPGVKAVYGEKPSLFSQNIRAIRYFFVNPEGKTICFEAHAKSSHPDWSDANNVSCEAHTTLSSQDSAGDAVSASARRNDSKTGPFGSHGKSARRSKSSLRSHSSENTVQSPVIRRASSYKPYGSSKSSVFPPPWIFRRQQCWRSTPDPPKGTPYRRIARKREKASSLVGNIRSIKRYRELRAMPPDKQITIERLTL